MQTSSVDKMAFGWRVICTDAEKTSDGMLRAHAERVTGQGVPPYGSLTTRVEREGSTATFWLWPNKH